MIPDREGKRPRRGIDTRVLVAGVAVALVGVVLLFGLALRGGFRDKDERNAAESRPVGTSGFFWETGENPRSLVPLDEIISGGPPPDGIPPIDKPAFISIGAAKEWLAPGEPVLAFEHDGDARAYPLQILVWHEIVNDTVGGRPVVVTYCPLCNTGIVYDRTVAGEVTTFGTSGRLYKSDLVMYDRATKSLWVQFSGQAVVGPRIETELDMLDAGIMSFDEFIVTYPEGRVLSRDTGHVRRYGETPYAEYDASGTPFLFRGEPDPRLPAITRVVGVQGGGAAKAYVTEKLLARGPVSVLNDTVGSAEAVVFFKRGTSSALDAKAIREGKDVGQSAVFSRLAGSEILTFEVKGGRIQDVQTRSSWDMAGRAVAGPLEGKELTALPRVDTFWFAWAVFQPDTGIWRG